MAISSHSSRFLVFSYPRTFSLKYFQILRGSCRAIETTSPAIPCLSVSTIFFHGAIPVCDGGHGAPVFKYQRRPGVARISGLMPAGRSCWLLRPRFFQAPNSLRNQSTVVDCHEFMLPSDPFFSIQHNRQHVPPSSVIPFPYQLFSGRCLIHTHLDQLPGKPGHSDNFSPPPPQDSGAAALSDLIN